MRRTEMKCDVKITRKCYCLIPSHIGRSKSNTIPFFIDSNITIFIEITKYHINIQIIVYTSCIQTKKRIRKWKYYRKI